MAPEEERARARAWASKFLKSLRKKRCIQPEISSTVPYALLATEARGACLSDHRQRQRLDGRSNRAPQSRHSAILPAYFALWSGRAEQSKGDLAQLFEFATTKARIVPFSTARRHRECSSPKLWKPKCPGCLLRNLGAELTWPKI